jgi:hypothetical protein
VGVSGGCACSNSRAWVWGVIERACDDACDRVKHFAMQGACQVWPASELALLSLASKFPFARARSAHCRQTCARTIWRVGRCPHPSNSVNLWPWEDGVGCMGFVRRQCGAHCTALKGPAVVSRCGRCARQACNATTPARARIHTAHTRLGSA